MNININTKIASTPELGSLKKALHEAQHTLEHLGNKRLDVVDLAIYGIALEVCRRGNERPQRSLFINEDSVEVTRCPSPPIDYSDKKHVQILSHQQIREAVKSLPDNPYHPAIIAAMELSDTMAA